MDSTAAPAIAASAIGEAFALPARYADLRAQAAARPPTFTVSGRIEWAEASFTASPVHMSHTGKTNEGLAMPMLDAFIPERALAWPKNA